MKLFNYLFGIAFTLLAFASAAQTADQVREDVENTDAPVIEHGAIPAKCGDYLAEYVKNVDEMLALGQKHAKEGDNKEYRAEIKAVKERMDALQKEMKGNAEVLKDPDCYKAFINAQQKYSAYIQQNMHLFMPDR